MLHLSLASTPYYSWCGWFTWLSKLFDCLLDIGTVALTRYDQGDVLKGLGGDENRVALGGQRLTFR